MREAHELPWRPRPPLQWESWGINGEVCVAGLAPARPGHVRLASCLWWLMRSIASRGRRTHDLTGALTLTSRGPRAPGALEAAIHLGFDLALSDPALIRERVLRRGGDPAARSWPSFWLEGDVYELPIPAVGSSRGKIVLLAEGHQAPVPARARRALATGLLRTWARALDAVASTDPSIVGRIAEDEQAFLVALMMLVHTRPPGRPEPRGTLEESWRRHETLFAQLAPAVEGKGLALVWHALWRLPAAMTWRTPGGEAWMRYPAVSFVAAARPLLTGRP